MHVRIRIRVRVYAGPQGIFACLNHDKNNPCIAVSLNYFFLVSYSSGFEIAQSSQEWMVVLDKYTKTQLSLRNQQTKKTVFTRR